MPDLKPEIATRSQPRWIETFEDFKHARVGLRETLIALIIGLGILVVLQSLPGEVGTTGPSLLNLLLRP